MTVWIRRARRLRPESPVNPDAAEPTFQNSAPLVWTKSNSPVRSGQHSGRSQSCTATALVFLSVQLYRHGQRPNDLEEAHAVRGAAHGVRGCRLGSIRVLAFSLAGLVALVVPSVGIAHLIHSNGVWTYRYLTRRQAADCARPSGGSDPLNVVMYQYGEGERMNRHAARETDWGFYNGHVPRVAQWICGDSDSAIGNYTVYERKDFDDQEGHGAWYYIVRAHFRIWQAPHSHPDAVGTWSTIDVHHEKLVVSTDINHKIDEPWDTWEAHFGSEMSVHHNLYSDYYVHQGGQNLQGFYDDGMITRVGGLHDGKYR